MSPFFWKTSTGLFRSSVTWEYTFPILLMAALAVAFAVLIGLQWRDLKSRVGSRVRWGLCLLRGGIYVLILIMLLNPTLVIQKVLRLLPELAIVIDTSGSMALSDSTSATDANRLNQAIDYLRSGSPSPLDTLAQTTRSSCINLMKRHSRSPPNN